MKSMVKLIYNYGKRDRMKQIMDGNKATSIMAYLFSEVCSIYPITPSSTMASNIDSMSSKECYNLFHDKVKVVEMQSEAGAAGAMHGALLTGSLASTFTASQGLLLMIPNMYKMAGECLPGVIHVASRTVATHALSIFGDHSDIYATRGTGFCMLCSNNPEECYHLAAVAHLSAIKGSLPFLHFFDGFRTSHELNVVHTLEESKLLQLVDKESLQNFKNRSLNIDKKIQYGLSETEDVYFQSVEARAPYYEKMADTVNFYMEKMNEIAGTHYKPFVYYGSENAKYVIVAMGSVCDTIRLVVSKENQKGNPIGLLEVHLYRPFSKKYFLNVLPKSVERIAVLDRTKESGSIGEPLYLDVLSVLNGSQIQVVGGRYGLSSKNTTPSDIYAVYTMLEENPKNNFTIGITDDLNQTSLPTTLYQVDLNAKEIQIFGFGSDGMVSASKDLLSILGEKHFVQGYFSYDSKKSGGVTVSHLRIGDQPILAPYYVTNADLIVITKEEYFSKYPILENAKENAILILNTVNEGNCFEQILESNYRILKEKNIKIYTIDAETIAMNHHIPGKISKIMEVVLLHLLGVSNPFEVVKESIQKQFRTKGEDIVKNNVEATFEALQKLREYHIVFSSTPIERVPRTLFEKMNQRLGDTLTTKEVEEIKTGCFPGELTKYEKRNTSHLVPKWISENCIQCGMCSFVCPHAVIRPFLVKEGSTLEAIGAPGYYYLISVSESDCTGCGLCVRVCPGKMGQKALVLDKKEKQVNENVSKLFELEKPYNPFSKFTMKGSQFEKPKFEFSGACAGCGETAYIKLLTQLYGDSIVIANATGCSSIYGGSAPSTPYSLSWANSLFEDNAEFAYGMEISYQTKRMRIKQILKESFSAVSSEIQDLYQEFLTNFDDFEKTKEVQEKLKTMEIPNDLKELMPYVPARTVWAIGGDGWAYDIGFGGIDHVLSGTENVKILVLDTEVYSNTGGQMSKSSPMGAVAEFADLGKRSHKKDLFRIAIGYPNCYVASVSMGANMMQTIKAFKEASEHVGPSIIIAYSTCIEQGIKGGMSCSLEEQKLAVDAGYTLLMRYKPSEEKLYLDSKKPDFSLYPKFLENEVRYRALKIKNKDQAEALLKENQEQAERRYQYYENLVKE